MCGVFTRWFVFWENAAAAAKSLQSCLTLCNPIDGSQPGSPVPGILQARTLEWIAISFSNVWKWKVKVKLLSRVRLLATPWTAVYQALPSMGSSRQEYWSGVPLPSLREEKILWENTDMQNRLNKRSKAWMDWCPGNKLIRFLKELLPNWKHKTESFSSKFF